MAIDFDGAASKIEHITAGHNVTTQVTILAWVLADGMGEANFGRIISIAETATGRFYLSHNNSANTLYFQATWGTTVGGWTFPATDGQWNHVAISYDAGSTANDPVVRVNGASVTVTEISTPAGTWTNPPTGYSAGNNTGQTATWDGGISFVRVFNRILSASEMDSEYTKPGSVRDSIRLFLDMINTGRIWDLSGNGFHPTLTSIADRAGPPVRTAWMVDEDEEFGLEAASPSSPFPPFRNRLQFA